MNSKIDILLVLLGFLFVIWFALLFAPLIDNNIFDIISVLPSIFKNPTKIVLCNNSLKSIVFFIFLYFLIVLYFFYNQKNYRKREEYGSAKWGKARDLNKKYCQEPRNMNKILTKNVSIGFDGRSHRRNLNVLVCGGSGAGKTRFYCKPNIMQANTSFFVLDPKGEIIRDTGYLLKEKGYEVKVLDLIDMKRSHCYNPFCYLETDNDVQKLVTNLFNSTTPKNSSSSDPFWDTAASMLLSALIFYLKYEAPEEEQNFSMVMEMLRAGEVKEDDESYLSPLDILFSRLELKNPNHIALKYYRSYRSAAGKTLKSIQITLASRLDKFNLPSVTALTITDELDIQSLGEKKVALFAIIPDNDTSFNFLVSILYTQMFQQLFNLADRKYGGALPIPVHFIMDEFANIGLYKDFNKTLSVMRSRQISVSIILQNMSQLRALFEKEWKSIVGNCDEFLYLGGNEQFSHRYLSELMGKATIDINTYGKSSGRNGNYSTNYQLGGRELMTPDEVRLLDNDYAILLIRGERPIKDLKYDILKHPNLKYTTDGNFKPYVHGDTENSIASISLCNEVHSSNNIVNIDFKEEDFEVILSEEIDKYFEREEFK